MRASSGSLMSANSAVTVLRSPSGAAESSNSVSVSYVRDGSVGDRETERSSSLPTELESRRVFGSGISDRSVRAAGCTDRRISFHQDCPTRISSSAFSSPRVPQVAFSTRLQSYQDVPMLPIPFPDRN